MSEAAAASGSAGGADASATPATADKGSSTQDTQQRSTQSASDRGEGQGSAQNQNQPAKKNEPVDDSEEITLGSVKGKVPKALAKAIKDYERGAQQKMRDASEIRKQIEQRDSLLHLLAEDPDKFAQAYKQATGKTFDPDSFAIDRLARKYERENMDPRERALLEREERLKDVERQELQSKQGVIKDIYDLLGDEAPKNLEQYPKEKLLQYLQHHQQKYQATQASLDKEVMDAWKESGLPKHRYFGALMSFHMMSHQKRTGEPLQATEAAAKVKTDFVNSVKEIISQMDPQGIQDLIGKDTLAKIRQADIDRVTGKTASQVGTQNRPGNQPASDKPRRPMNEREWENWARGK
jgi:hypothetical protein